MADVGRMTGTSRSREKAAPLELGRHGNTRWRCGSRCSHHRQADGQYRLRTRALTGSRGSRDTSVKGPQHERRQHGLGAPTWRSRGQPAGRRVTQSSCRLQGRRAPPPGSPPTHSSQAWATRSGWPDLVAHRHPQPPEGDGSPLSQCAAGSFSRVLNKVTDTVFNDHAAEMAMKNKVHSTAGTEEETPRSSQPWGSAT